VATHPLYTFSIVNIPAAVPFPFTMSTSDVLVAVAKEPELRFRKRGFVALTALLLVIGVIAITSTPSRTNGSEGFFLFDRTLFIKGDLECPAVACRIACNLDSDCSEQKCHDSCEGVIETCADLAACGCTSVDCGGG
jgi:hypothetical protein